MYNVVTISLQWQKKNRGLLLDLYEYVIFCFSKPLGSVMSNVDGVNQSSLGYPDWIKIEKTKTLTIDRCIKISINKIRSQSIWWKKSNFALLSRVSHGCHLVSRPLNVYRDLLRFMCIYILFLIYILYVSGLIRFSTFYLFRHYRRLGT